MQRTTLTIDGHSDVLAHSTHMGMLKSSVEDAVRDGGRFVDLTLAGNIDVSVLISPGVAVYLSTHEVEDDDRDTGDLAKPYDDQSIWDIADLI
jgi:hypothetical protein